MGRFCRWVHEDHHTQAGAALQASCSAQNRREQYTIQHQGIVYILQLKRAFRLTKCIVFQHIKQTVAWDLIFRPVFSLLGEYRTNLLQLLTTQGLIFQHLRWDFTYGIRKNKLHLIFCRTSLKNLRSMYPPNWYAKNESCYCMTRITFLLFLSKNLYTTDHHNNKFELPNNPPHATFPLSGT